MSRPIILDLPLTVVASVEIMTGRAGMTSAAWLAEQVSHAFGTGRVRETTDQTRRTHRGKRAREKFVRHT